MQSPAPADRPGRTLLWRLGMATAGAAAAGAGLAMILVPRLLAYAVGGTLAIVGLLLVASALAARGRA